MFECDVLKRLLDNVLKCVDFPHELRARESCTMYQMFGLGSDSMYYFKIMLLSDYVEIILQMIMLHFQNIVTLGDDLLLCVTSINANYDYASN